MKVFSLSLGIGFLVNNGVATLVAAAILNPWLNPMFNGMVRTQEQGLVMPALLSGYFIVTLLMVLGYRQFAWTGSWWKKGLVWGLGAGCVTFLAGHLIVAGWATLPALPMFLSGCLDVLPAAATGLVIAYLHRNE